MFESTTYERRRQALREKVQSGIILLLGNNEAPANYPDNCYKYRQASRIAYVFRGLISKISEKPCISMSSKDFRFSPHFVT